MIAVKNLTKQYGNHLVLDHITETIEAGEKIAIIGPSGSGKSTFLRCLNLLEQPTGGQIIFDGTDITKKAPTTAKTTLHCSKYKRKPNKTGSALTHSLFLCSQDCSKI